MAIGNVFKTSTTTYKPAQRVWRSVRHVYPVGGTIDAATKTAFKGENVIPAGTPCKYDADTKEVRCYSAKEVSTSGFSGVINGFTKEDIYVANGIGTNDVASAAVVYAGEIYGYMFDSAVLKVLQALTTVPQIVFV